MKFTEVTKLVAEPKGKNKGYTLYRGKAITEKSCTPYTGYRGRGLKPLEKTFPRGTEVSYNLKQYKIWNGEGYASRLEILFTDTDGEVYKIYYEQDCPIELAAERLGFEKIMRKHL